jgi:DNA repair exonuclease SbcCD ATPase subunit
MRVDDTKLGVGPTMEAAEGRRESLQNGREGGNLWFPFPSVSRPARARLAPPRFSIRLTMRILPLFAIAAGLALAANAQSVPEQPSIRVLDFKNHFPLQSLARDAEFKECLACFERVDSLASAEEAVRHAKDTKASLLQTLKVANTDQTPKAGKKDLADTIEWLNGPFTRYVARWQRLIDDLTARSAPVGQTGGVGAWRIAVPGDTLALIKSYHETHQDWIDHHSGIKEDLANLEATAKVLEDAKEDRDQRQAEEFHAAFAAAKGRAVTISKRESEKQESQDIAQELADRLKVLEAAGEPFVPLPVRTIATGEALALVRSVHETHQDWLDHHTGMKDDLAQLDAKAKALDNLQGRRAPEQEDAFYFAVDASTDRAEDIAQREDEPAESREFAQRLAGRLAKIE